MNSFMEKNQQCNNDGKGCEFQQALDMLRQVPFFSGIQLEALKVFAYLCVNECYPAGEMLMHQGENDGQAFLITQGQVELLYKGEQGEKVVGRYGAGDFIGGLSLLGDQNRVFSVRASEEVYVLLLTRDKFTKTIEQFPDVMPRILEAVVDNVTNWEQQFFARHAAECGDCAGNAGVSLV